METKIFPTELWKCKLNPVYSLITGDLLHDVCNQPQFKFVTGRHKSSLKRQIMQADCTVYSGVSLPYTGLFISNRTFYRVLT
jgi:hypothetical protein